MYYQNNVVATLDLLEAMRASGVWRIVFSSTTATYGQPEKMPITESALQLPINPYGFTKLVIEHALTDYANAYGFGCAALRTLMRPVRVPMVTLERIIRRSRIDSAGAANGAWSTRVHRMFGDDYPTPDGSCIRDYIHVDDLADAHLKALSLLEPGSNLQLNLGTGRGRV